MGVCHYDLYRERRRLPFKFELLTRIWGFLFFQTYFWAKKNNERKV